MDCIDLQSVPTRTPKTRVRRGANANDEDLKPASSNSSPRGDKNPVISPRFRPEPPVRANKPAEKPAEKPEEKKQEKPELSEEKDNGIVSNNEKTNFDDHTFTYGELMGIIQYLTVYWQKMKPHLIKMDSNLEVRGEFTYFFPFSFFTKYFFLDQTY